MASEYQMYSNIGQFAFNIGMQENGPNYRKNMK